MMAGRWPSVRGFVASVAAVLTLAMAVACVAFAVVNLGEGAPFDSDTGQMLAELTLGSGYAIVGLLVAARRPDNPLGWIYLGIGLSQVGESLLALASVRGLVLSPGSIPAADVLAWLGTFGWVPGFGLLLTFSLLLFPTGHLPSNRWRPVAWLSVVAMLLLSVPIAVAAWPLRGAALVGVGPDVPEWAKALQLAGLISMCVVAITGIASIVVRWRRSSGLERQQLKWFAWAVIPVIGAIVVSGFVTFPPALWVLTAVFVTPLLPAAIGIAILRYRLYDIDRIISRTLGWAIVTGVLVVVFAAGVVALQAALSGFTQGQTLAVAASTLVAFALFQRIRRRVQRAVDRRFDRARYDAEQTASAFAERLRDEVDIEAVAGDLRSTAHAALAPGSLAVWLREAER